LCLLLGFGAAQLQLGPDRVDLRGRLIGSVAERGACGSARSFDALHQLAHQRHRPGQQSGIGWILNVGRHHGGVGADFPVFTNFAASARASSASFSPSTASSPHRVVIFDKVDGAGADPSRLSRQKISHEIESLTSRHSDS
jgi:hypothetical protein